MRRTPGYFLRGSVLLIFSFVLLTVGCAREEGLLKNPGFKASENGIKAWSLEGEATIEKAEGGGVMLTARSGAPFLYQQTAAKKRLKGSTISLGAWVRTDQPDSVFIEFSNRLGIDGRSEAHPGDGRWHLITVTERVPEASQVLEFRLRVSKPGVAFIKDASMSPGSSVAINGAGPGLEAPAYLAFMADGTFLVVMFGLVARFQQFRDTAYIRMFEVSVLLALLSAMVLVLGRNSNALVVSNIAWAAGSAGCLVYIVRNLKPPFSAYIPGAGALISVCTGILLVLTIVSIGNGATAIAGKTALIAYMFFISALIAIPVYHWYIKAAQGQARMTIVRIYKASDHDTGE